MRVTALFFCLFLAENLASAQVVTATKLVSYYNKKELLRQINGRWWSTDNREVSPPSKTGMFWELTSEPGVVDFYHHEPFDLRRAERLHLFTPLASVQPLLGPPNVIFKMGPESAMWFYYAANGTRVRVRIMEGVVGEAQYEPVRGKPYPVATLSAELAGRSIYTLLAERATQRLRQSPASAPSPRLTAPVAIAPPPEKRIVSSEALSSVHTGMSRAELLAALGEPSSRFSISTGDGLRETFRYHLPDGAAVELRMTDGKVTQVP